MARRLDPRQHRLASLVLSHFPSVGEPCMSNPSTASTHDLFPVPAAGGGPGPVIGPYRLISLLGRGGMGVVYEAVHQVTGRAVALKVVDLTGDHLKHHLEQVTHEAMAMAALRHPHIVTCYSFGEDGRHLYLALELIRGGDTADLVKRHGGRLDEATIRALAGQCLQGLAAIHRAGLLHRDIKPANILLDEHGNAKLADFGLACFDRKKDDAAVDGGRPGIMPENGTPAYMPPEAITSDCTPDIRGDLYSLGVTMYYWAVGSSPFSAGSSFVTMQKVLAGGAPDLGSLRPEFSAELVAIIATAMQARRELRHADPEAMLRALRGEAATPAPVTLPAAPITPPTPASSPRLRTPWYRDRRMIPLAAALAVVALLLMVPARVGARGDGTDATATTTAPADPGPAQQAAGAGYRVAWLGDPLVRFVEIGAVTYSHAGEHLHLADEAWLDGTAAPSLTRLLRTAGGFSVELVIVPANLTQEGPARIFSIGVTARAANLMIGQSGSRLELRVRTTVTNPDGTRPHLVSDDGVLREGRHHVVVVRSGHQHVVYVDGVLRGACDVPGDLSNWDDAYPLCVGNDHRGGFPWNGACEKLVLASRPWTAEEVATRYRRWSGEQADPPAR